MNSSSISYEWYGIISGDEIQQGDFLDLFPIPSYPMDTPIIEEQRENFSYETKMISYNVVVMTQSCDITKFEEKQIYDKMITLCARYDFKKQFGSKGKWNELVNGRLIGVHLLSECTIEGYELDYQVVALSEIFTVPYGYVKKYAEAQGNRLRLLPPYREQLSQAFARNFMRVGLPLDLPREYPYKE